MRKKRQSNKDECTRVTLQEVKLHSDRNREAVAAAAILAGLEGVEGEERNGGAFWELPKSPHTGSQNEEGGKKDRGWGGGSSVSMATVIAIAVVFPWTHLPSSSSFLQSAPLTPSLLHC